MLIILCQCCHKDKAQYDHHGKNGCHALADDNDDHDALEEKCQSQDSHDYHEAEFHASLLTYS